MEGQWLVEIMRLLGKIGGGVRITHFNDLYRW